MVSNIAKIQTHTFSKTARNLKMNAILRIKRKIIYTDLAKPI